MYMFISSQAVYSFALLRGLNLISEGRFAVYVNGPDRVSKSWVPMATSALFLKVERKGDRKREGRRQRDLNIPKQKF